MPLSAFAAIGVGDTLDSALRDFQRHGTRLFWSSQLVTAGMRVGAAPHGESIVDQLRSLLAPFDLDIRSLGTDGWVVVEASPEAIRTVQHPAASPGPAALPDSLRQIIVETSRYALSSRQGIDAARLSRAQAEHSPDTHEDMMRALQQFPGTAAGDYSARPHVRGSRADEIGVRYDGVTLIDPYHLKNFSALFSAIDPAVTDAVEFWSGDFPIQYGGSIGAVASFAARRPTQPSVEVGLSVLNTSVLLGTPFARDRGSVMIAGRVSNLSHLARFLDRDIGEPEFGDLTARMTWKLSESAEVSAGVLGLGDALQLATDEPLQQASASYRDRYGWVRALYQLPHGFQGESLLSFANLMGHRSAMTSRPGINDGQLQESRDSSVLTLRQELAHPLGTNLDVHIGSEFVYSSSTAALENHVTFQAPFFPALQSVPRFDRSLAAHAHDDTLALYGAGRWRLTSNSVLEVGVRRDSQRFKGDVERSQWSTRVNFRQRLSSSSTLRIAWGQYSQPQSLSQLNLADGLGALDLVRRAHQTTLSWEQELPEGWMLRVGAYDKHEVSRHENFDNIFSNLVLTPEIEVDRIHYVSGGARMRGVELSVQSDPNRPLTGWVSYSRSRATDRIDGLDVARSWNQPHAFQVGLQWNRGPWRASGIFNWHSGWPFTPLTYSPTWSDAAGASLSLESRNSAQFRGYRSLDLRMSWLRPLRRGALEISLELRNVFNSANPCCRSFEVVDEGTGRFELLQTTRNWLPITPLLSVRWQL